MEKRKDKGGKAVSSCSCEICLLHPHLKGALRRMRPPELRLFSRAELLLLLERDICSAGDTNSKFQVKGIHILPYNMGGYRALVFRGKQRRDMLPCIEDDSHCCGCRSIAIPARLQAPQV